MSRLKKFLRDPELRDLWHVVPWIVLLAVLTMYGIPWLWLFIAGCYAYYRLLRWSIRADRREKFDRKWTALMTKMEEVDRELHDEAK